MVADPNRQRISVEEYLRLEQVSEMRHEYIDGYAYAMSGGTATHSWLGVNVVRLFDEQLRSGPCRVFNSDMRVRLSEKRYVYPDMTISCDVADSQGGNEVVCSPRLVVEILSPSTELYDRGKKFTLYQECSTIQEYMLVSTRRQMIEVYRRIGDVWRYQCYPPWQTVELKSLDIELPFEAIYARARVPIEEDDEVFVAESRREDVRGDGDGN